MPVTDREQELAKETIETLQKVASQVMAPVRISPERMEAFHRMSRMRMNVNIEGRTIVLEEHADAPELAVAIDEAIPKAPDPEPAPDACALCHAQRVRLDDGDILCKGCRTVTLRQNQSSVILASERSRMAAMQHEAEKNIARQDREQLTKHSKRKR